MEEPQAHLLRAQEDLSNKDVKGAAAEIRMAGTFLKIQEKRLGAVVSVRGSVVDVRFDATILPPIYSVLRAGRAGPGRRSRCWRSGTRITCAGSR
jgi:hypothetical protein